MTVLIDQAVIHIRAGRGGDGCASFRREKYVPKGGPDGGNGGEGGSVVLVGDPDLDTLVYFSARPHHRAGNGVQGMGKSMSGADGADCILNVPLGTLVFDEADGSCVCDISRAGQSEIVARGGQGGLGNEHFKSSINQTPREWTRGEMGEEKSLRLELKLIADVGLIGLPNAGKSTLLRAISRATPKVAAYPFTTITPNLGIAELTDERRIVFADIPGLVEGAAQGAGLGHDFLRHIERTTMLVHVVDIAPIDGSDPATNYETIRRELFEYAPALAEKREIIVFNKIDLLPDEDDRAAVLKRFAGRVGLQPGEQPLFISAATGEGTRELLELCWQRGEESTDDWLSAGRRDDG
ncbi:MAG: GTPase ObgE [Phycisphaerales bacterium]